MSVAARTHVLVRPGRNCGTIRNKQGILVNFG
nr:hypothetical protein BOSE7B_150821 [Bosea sp. 7B]